MLYFECRRIPNTGHGVTGYEESLASFYLTVVDVSKYYQESLFDYASL
jgi:hypothetical protein